MPCYHIHGLAVSLPIACQGLVASSDAPVDLEFVLDGYREPSALPSLTELGWTELSLDKGNHALALRVWRQPGVGGIRYLLRFSGGDHAEYIVAADFRRVEIVWTRPQVEVAHLMTLALGPVLGVILRLGGRLALHASAVAIDGHAIAILGHSGSGKSTLVASLLRGHGALLSDDLSLVDGDPDGVPSVLAGQAGLKLWPDSLSHLGERSSDWPTVFSDTTKRYMALAAPDGPARMPLSGIFLLGPFTVGVEGPGLELLSPQRALAQLSKHLYVPFIPISPHARAELFRRQCRLATAVPTYEVTRPHGLEFLPRVCEEIVQRTVRAH